ncbi:hypothetical protein N9Z27_02840 [Alphaproteobacteria bacterium]|nr:hypothetical protein [Alphaproteobacteria bacterium]
MSRFSLLLVFVLVACAGNPSNLTEEYRDKNLSMNLSSKSNSLEVLFTRSNAGYHGGGLLGVLVSAAVSTAIETHTRSEASNFRKSVKASFDSILDANNLEQTYVKQIQAANWISINNVFSNDPTLDIPLSSDYYDEVAANLAMSSNDYHANLIIDHKFDQKREYRQVLVFQIFHKYAKDPESPIYSVLLKESYSISDSVFSSASDEDWVANNGENIRKAIAETTNKISQKFQRLLNNPYDYELHKDV